MTTARILLVEGNERDARRMHDTLRERPGWEVVRAGTLLEAIRAGGEARFDAAVLDANLPDGSGLDILDFLRIGSPGIRILLLADKPSEAVAFHALSHGAGDLLVKDPHLEQELPRRIDALLVSEPIQSYVETLTPHKSYETPAPPKSSAVLAPAQTEPSELDALLESLVAGSILGAGVFDLRGRVLAAKFPKDLEPEGIGFAAATLHGQVGAFWTYGNLKPTGYRTLVDVEGGLLALTAIPGTYIVALLLESGFAPRRALERVDQAGMRVLAALQGNPSGGDLANP